MGSGGLPSPQPHQQDSSSPQGFLPLSSFPSSVSFSSSLLHKASHTRDRVVITEVGRSERRITTQAELQGWGYLISSRLPSSLSDEDIGHISAWLLWSLWHVTQLGHWPSVIYFVSGRKEEEGFLISLHISLSISHWRVICLGRRVSPFPFPPALPPLPPHTILKSFLPSFFRGIGLYFSSFLSSFRRSLSLPQPVISGFSSLPQE